MDEIRQKQATVIEIKHFHTQLCPLSPARDTDTKATSYIKEA